MYFLGGSFSTPMTSFQRAVQEFNAIRFAKVLVSNLPADTTVDEVREDWASFGAPILAVELVKEGNPDQLTFVVEVDIDHSTAKVMADRRRDRFFKGRKIEVYVPTVMG